MKAVKFSFKKMAFKKIKEEVIGLEEISFKMTTKIF